MNEYYCNSFENKDTNYYSIEYDSSAEEYNVVDSNGIIIMYNIEYCPFCGEKL